MKREKRLFPIVNDEIEEMTSFIIQFYHRKNSVFPKEILVPESLPKEILEEMLPMPVRTPQRGEKRALLEMAGKNARLVLEEKFRLLELDEKKTTGAMKEITDALGIAPGHKIEAFDTHTSRVLIWFQQWSCLLTGSRIRIYTGNISCEP